MTHHTPHGRARPTGNVLVVYGLFTHPLRSTVEDHLLAFRRYSNRRVFHLNARAQDVPAHILRRRFDMIVFHTTFLSNRWAPGLFLEMCDRVEPLKALAGVRVAMPQDEFLRTKLVCDFIDDFGIDVVCSVAPESEWAKIYPTVDRDRVRFHRVLTGYLDARTVHRIEHITQATRVQDVDIGYRAWRGASWLGRHGTLKGTIADAVIQRGRGLRLDISTRDEETLLGDEWFRFLARCRYTIGIEGGASVLDFDGSIKERTERYEAEHPGASFDEVEAACFPGEDGRLALFAISPRHLEACTTRTCQVLVEGSYNGILEPDRHYIPLRSDLSNLDAVLDSLGDEARRRRMVEAAYRDVVESGRYTYRAMVEDVERFALGDGDSVALGGRRDRAALTLNRMTERMAWARIAAVVRWLPRLARTRIGRSAAAALRASRRTAQNGRRRGAAVKTVVSVTPLAVERDSRTFKVAASMARLGYRSIVVEGEPSGSLCDAVPFELISVGGRRPARESSVDSSSDAGTLIGRLAARAPEPIRRLAGPRLRALLPLAAYPSRCYAIAAAMPSADLYYLHSQYPFPSVWWRARFGRRPFVYDAHDLYWTLRTDGRPMTFFDHVTWRVWDRIERLAARRADACVTVGEGVARHAQDRFGRTFAVVRNLHDGRLDTTGAPGIRTRLGLGAEDVLIAVAGNFKRGMAVGPMLRALAGLPDRVHLAFVGANYEDWVTAAGELGVAERMHVMRPVLPTEVVPLLSEADLAAVPYFPSSISVRHALPNGFFLAVAAGVPVLYPSQLDDLRELAERYDVGWEIDPESDASIRSVVQGILDAPDELSRRRAGVRNVRDELSWGTDEKELARVISTVLNGRTAR
jgi:glycosyltransferase involved in cell wall biosynthesis